MKLERRVFAVPSLALRAAGDAKKITGHAAVFDSPYESYGYTEKIARGAFADSIKRDDIRALFNHDVNLVLGRVASGTLELYEDTTGLAFACTPPETQYARDLAAVIERGDVSGCSIGFFTRSDAWNKVDGTWVRTLLEIELHDVGPVTFPAYTETDVALRATRDASSGLFVPAPPDESWIHEAQHRRARLALAAVEV